MKRDRVWTEDLIGASCGSALVAGLLLDGWNHLNLQDGALGSFFTPWHGLLYAGFTSSACWVMYRNRHLFGRAPVRPQYQRVLGVPLRYPYAVVGIVIATVGLFGDIGWHAAFGEEIGVARVIAPFHLALFCGGALVLAAPVRSAWHAPDVYPRDGTIVDLLPPILSLAALSALGCFLFQWLSAFMDWTADDASDTEVIGVARVLVTNLMLFAPLLVAMRRWRLPVGTCTAVFGSVALLIAALTNLHLGWTVLAAVAGGMAGDAAGLATRSARDRFPVAQAITALATLGLWSAYFAVLGIVYDRGWPVDLALGTVGLCTLASVGLSMIAVPPARLRAVSSVTVV